MTTDELFKLLPKFVCTEHRIGWITLKWEGGTPPWKACYETSFGDVICLNYDSKEPPYNNANAWGETPYEALYELYNWCIKNNFIKTDKNETTDN